MQKIVSILFLSTFLLFSENNATDANKTKDANVSDINNSILKSNLQKAIEAEKKFKAEQKFYMGDEYNLSEHQVNPQSVKKTPLIEPEYDFDMTDVYSD